MERKVSVLVIGFVVGAVLSFIMTKLLITNVTCSI